MFCLVDCNNFYASCERVFNPRLQNRPIIVLSNNDGCVIARSNEAKSLGIAMGVPFYQIRPIVRQYHVKVFSSNFALYGDMSRRVMISLQRFCEHMEVYSIDEAFLLLEDIGNYHLFSQGLRAQVLQWTGIPVSVGIAPTKTLAKVANFFAKKNSPQGYCVIPTAASADSLLEKMALDDLWGVGRGFARKLQRLGICTARDLKYLSHGQIRRYLNVMGERLVLELNGLCCFELEQKVTRKTIRCARSFATAATSQQQLEQALSIYATRACERMRHAHLKTQRITVFLHTNFHRQNEPQYSRKVEVSLLQATVSTSVVITAALEGLAAIYRDGYRYQKIGIILSQLFDIDLVQYDLFFPVVDDSQHCVSPTIDKINDHMGRDTVFHASSGMPSTWLKHTSLKSPRYTTAWSDLPRAH